MGFREVSKFVRKSFGYRDVKGHRDRFMNLLWPLRSHACICRGAYLYGSVSAIVGMNKWAENWVAVKELEVSYHKSKGI